MPAALIFFSSSEAEREGKIANQQLPASTLFFLMRSAAALAEVGEEVRAPVDGPLVGAVAGGEPEALSARRVAPARREVHAGALRRERQEAQAALVAARPHPRARAHGGRRRFVFLRPFAVWKSCEGDENNQCDEQHLRPHVCFFNFLNNHPASGLLIDGGLPACLRTEKRAK